MSNKLPRPPEELILFRDVQRAHHNAIMAALAARDVQDVGQPQVLILLSSLQDGAANQWELAEAVHVTPSTMTASLKSLERQGYVTRQVDPKDGRCKRVVITQKGIDAVEKCREAFHEVDEALFVGFTADEVTRIRQDYRHMLDNLYAVGGDRQADDAPPPPALIPKGKEGNS